MRVATVFCGAAAASTAFGPAAMANTKVPAPYVLTVYTNGYVYKEQVCAYFEFTAGNQWYCSPIRKNPHFNASAGSVDWGGNWADGKVNVWVWNGSGREFLATCNTNGAYNGHFKAAGGVSLTAGGGSAIGPYTGQEC
jgi:hypothetical protein